MGPAEKENDAYCLEVPVSFGENTSLLISQIWTAERSDGAFREHSCAVRLGDGEPKVGCWAQTHD